VATRFRGTKAAPTQITSWSYSRWKDYATCPARAKYKHLLRLPDPGGAALDRGIAIHGQCETYLKTGAGLTEEVRQHFEKEMAALRKAQYVAEAQWAFDVNYVPTEWYARDAFLRIKTDAHKFDRRKKHVTVIDFKTGKIREDEYDLQLDLYALGAFAQYPACATASAELWYFDAGKIVDGDRQYSRDVDFPRLKEEWAARIASMLCDTVFVPTPGYGCRWCPYSKAAKGPCKF